MNEHPNATLMREALAAMNAGQVEAMSRYIADDVAWHYIGGSEPLRGKDALLGAFGPGNTDWEITTETHDVTASDDHVVARVTATATREGKTFVYAPTKPREQEAETALKRLVRTFFNGSVEHAVSGLLRINDRNLDAAELERIEKMLEEAKNK